MKKSVEELSNNIQEQGIAIYDTCNFALRLDERTFEFAGPCDKEGKYYSALIKVLENGNLEKDEFERYSSNPRKIEWREEIDKFVMDIFYEKDFKHLDFSKEVKNNLMFTKEVGAYLGISKQAVCKKVERGQLVPIKKTKNAILFWKNDIK